MHLLTLVYVLVSPRSSRWRVGNVGLEGKKFKRPKRLTGFTIEDTFVCPGGNRTIQVSLPIDQNKKEAKVQRDKKEGLTFFNWSYDFIYELGITLESYKLVGGQHHKHPEVGGDAHWERAAVARKEPL